MAGCRVTRIAKDARVVPLASVVLRPSAAEVVEPVEYDACLKAIAAAMHLKREIHSFPARPPISVTTRNLAAVRTTPHVALPKTNGVHFLLVLTEVGGLPRALMMDRALRIFGVAFAAPRAAFRGTVVEGELIEAAHLAGTDALAGCCLDPAATARAFLVFEVLDVYGQNLRSWRYLDRLHAFESVLPRAADRGRCSQCAADATRLAQNGRLLCMQPGLDLCVKQVYPAVRMSRVYKRYAGAGCDGIILAPDVAYTSALPTVKVKTEHSIDLRMEVQRVVDADGVQLSLQYSVCYEEADKDAGLTRAVRRVYGLVDARKTLVYCGKDVDIEVVRNERLLVWLRQLWKHPVGTVQYAVGEFRVTFRRLKAEEAAEVSRRVRDIEKKRVRTHYGAHARARNFQWRMTVELQKIRPDKLYPNTLTTIVSTLAESTAMHPSRVQAFLSAVAKGDREA